MRLRSAEPAVQLHELHRESAGQPNF